VVFKGDRLPFHCTATLVDKITTLHWRHNGQLVTSDPEMGVQLEDSELHDCTFITRYRNILNDCMIKTIHLVQSDLMKNNVFLVLHT